MNVRVQGYLLRLLLLSICSATAVLCSATAVFAQQLPYYYPAYGSQHGKIHYHQGLFGTHQKIRWGNGFTPTTAGVIHDLSQAAIAIVPSVLAPRSAEPDDQAASRAARAAESATEDATRQQAADDLLARTNRLAARYGLAPTGGAAPAPANGGSAQPASAHNDDFRDWDNTGAAPPPRPSSNLPPPPKPGDTSNPAKAVAPWDNTGTAPAGNNVAPQPARP